MTFFNMRFFLLLGVTIIMMGCVIPIPPKAHVSQKAVAHVIPGKTSETEIIAKFGEPHAQWEPPIFPASYLLDLSKRNQVKKAAIYRDEGWRYCILALGAGGGRCTERDWKKRSSLIVNYDASMVVTDFQATGEWGCVGSTCQNDLRDHDRHLRNLEILCYSAERGSGAAQSSLGSAYWYGTLGLKSNKVQAFKWWLISNQHGYRYGPNLHDFKQQMTKEETQESERLFENWKTTGCREEALSNLKSR